MARGSGGLRLIEFGDLVYEPLRVLRVEVVRRAVDDLQHATIAGDGLPVFAPLLMDVAEELPSVRDIRIALDEMAGGGLDLFQLAFLDEAKGGVDRLVQVVLVVRGGGEAGRDRVAGLALLQAPGFGARLAPGLLGGEPVALGRLVPRAGSTPCISCRFRKGSDRCVRAWPSGSSASVGGRILVRNAAGRRQIP